MQCHPTSIAVCCETKTYVHECGSTTGWSASIHHRSARTSRVPICVSTRAKKRVYKANSNCVSMAHCIVTRPQPRPVDCITLQWMCRVKNSWTAVYRGRKKKKITPFEPAVIMHTGKMTTNCHLTWYWFDSRSLIVWWPITKEADSLPIAAHVATRVVIHHVDEENVFHIQSDWVHVAARCCEFNKCHSPHTFKSLHMGKKYIEKQHKTFFFFFLTMPWAAGARFSFKSDPCSLVLMLEGSLVANPFKETFICVAEA